MCPPCWRRELLKTVGECHGSDPCGADSHAACERGTRTVGFFLPSCVQVMSLSVSSSRPCAFLYDALAAIREDDILVRSRAAGWPTLLRKCSRPETPAASSVPGGDISACDGVNGNLHGHFTLSSFIAQTCIARLRYIPLHLFHDPSAVRANE